MLIKSNIIKIFLGVLILGVWVCPSVSYADWSIGVGVGDRDEHHRDHWDHDEGHHYYRWHDHPHYGYRSHFLPVGYEVVLADGRAYY